MDPILEKVLPIVSQYNCIAILTTLTGDFFIPMLTYDYLYVLFLRFVVILTDILTIAMFCFLPSRSSQVDTTYSSRIVLRHSLQEK